MSVKISVSFELSDELLLILCCKKDCQIRRRFENVLSFFPKEGQVQILNSMMDELQALQKIDPELCRHAPNHTREPISFNQSSVSDYEQLLIPVIRNWRVGKPLPDWFNKDFLSKHKDIFKFYPTEFFWNIAKGHPHLKMRLLLESSANLSKIQVVIELFDEGVLDQASRLLQEGWISTSTLRGRLRNHLKETKNHDGMAVYLNWENASVNHELVQKRQLEREMRALNAKEDSAYTLRRIFGTCSPHLDKLSTGIVWNSSGKVYTIFGRPNAYLSRIPAEKNIQIKYAGPSSDQQAPQSEIESSEKTEQWIRSLKKPSGVVKVPSVIGKSKITGLKKSAFLSDYNNEAPPVLAVILEEGIQFIGDEAFWDVDSLKYIFLPESIQFLGKACFKYTSIRELVIPSPDCCFSGFPFGQDEAGTRIYVLANSSTQASLEFILQKWMEFQHSNHKTSSSYFNIIPLTQEELERKQQQIERKIEELSEWRQ